jgi:hypothetical protein
LHCPLWCWNGSRPATPFSIHEWFLYLNLVVITRLRACDLFIGMADIYLEAERFAKRRLSVWLERASWHILSQNGILAIILAQALAAAEQKMEMDANQLRPNSHF